MKKCTECSIPKPLTEFYKDKGMPDGHRGNCKVCKNAKTMKWREVNKDKYNADMRVWRKNNPDEVKNTDLRRNYGNAYDLDWYRAKREEQNNVCAICEKPQEGIRPLVVDHCHATLKVRDLLCYSCNRDMSAIDNRLEKLLEYKKKHE